MPHGRRYWSRLAILALAYYLTAVVGAQWAAIDGAGSPVWPAAGVALAGLMLGGLNLWPAVFVGRMALVLFPGTDNPTLTIALVSAGNAVSALVVAWLLLRLVDLRLGRVADILWLAAGCALTAAIAGLVGTFALDLTVGLSLTEAVPIFANWTAGNTVGALTMAPLILAWASRGETRPGLREWAHLGLILAVTVALAGMVFLGPWERILRPWAIYPALIWAAVAWGMRGASAAVLIVALITVAGATLDSGALRTTAHTPQEHLFMAHQFVAISALMTLILAAAIDERHIKRALFYSEERFRLLVEGVRDHALYMLDANGRVATWNAGAERLKGWTAADIVGRDYAIFFPPEERAAGTPQRLLRMAYESGGLVDKGWRLRADGSRFLAQVTLTPLMDANGTLRGYAEIEHDVTQVLAAEQALKSSEARLRAILEQMPIGVAVARAPSGELLFHNARAGEILGHPMLAAADTTGYVRYGALHDPDTPFKPDEHPIARAALFGEVVDRLLMLYRRGDGRIIHLEVSAAPIQDSDGNTVLAVATFEDVEDRLRHEDALRRSEEHLRLAQEAGRIATWESVPSLGMLSWSGPINDLLGRPADAPSPDFADFMRLVHRDDRMRFKESIAASFRDRKPIDIEVRACLPDKSIRWLAVRGDLAPDGDEPRMTGAAFDVNERREAAEALERLNADLEERVAQAAAELVQLQKMESLDRLTGGIAHDFNNLLMAISSSLDLLRRIVPRDDARAHDLIDNAAQASRGGAELTQRMLAFSRKQELRPQMVPVPEMVDEMRTFLTRTLGQDVEIATEFTGPHEGLIALADRNQLELALLNLALNARDAMPNGGDLSMTVDRVTVAARDADGMAPGAYVRLRITDTGHGMDAATLRRAAEPFFTTKPVGQGTGLGLSMVYGLARQSGGRFSLTSNPGDGTTAELLLPTPSASELAAAVPEPSQAPPPPAERPPLSVLVVDDDALVLMGLTGVVEDLGHRALAAGSGPEALDILRGGQVVDVLVTDQAMPDMTGLQLARHAKAEWPDLPVVLASGYADLPEDSGAVIADRLHKPFTADDLAAVLGRVTSAP